MMKHALFLSCAMMASVEMASAQAPPLPATPPAHTAPPASADNCTPVPPRGTIAPEGTTTGQRGEPLGDRPTKSGGMPCPPDGVDPEIRAPTPDTGNTPVIPPPGSPGGNPKVQPK